MIKPENFPIRERILKLAEKFGIKDIKKGGALARKLGVHNSVIKRLIEYESLPTIDNLIKISENAGISTDYLIFGGEYQLHIGEHRDISYDARQPAPIDTELIAAVATQVQQYLDKHRLKIGPKRFGKLISLSYEQCVTDKIKPESLEIKSLLLLTAMIEG